MRVNVYTEELINGGDKPLAEIVTAEYVSSRTGEKMKNYGLRIYLISPPELHYIPGRDDDRSAVTFWCGSDKKNIGKFLDAIKTALEYGNMIEWRAKVTDAATRAEVNVELGHDAIDAGRKCELLRDLSKDMPPQQYLAAVSRIMNG